MEKGKMNFDWSQPKLKQEILHAELWFISTGHGTRNATLIEQKVGRDLWRLSSQRSVKSQLKRIAQDFVQLGFDISKDEKID